MPKLETSLKGLTEKDWLSGIADLRGEKGYFERLGTKHSVLFANHSPRLLVSFSTIEAAREGTFDGLPRGLSLLPHWSHLVFLSDGETWFRDEAVFGHFDNLVDEAFLDDFDEVVFFGTGSAGYAAAAFSVAAPGARVVLLEPQATLDPRITGWDTRFRRQRRISFTDRYGYAPHMIDAASEVLVYYDSQSPVDAMHASLFARPHVRLKPLAHMGGEIEAAMAELGMLGKILSGNPPHGLGDAALGRLWRARRCHLPYLRGLLARADRPRHERRALAVCRHGAAQFNAPRFHNRLKTLEAVLKKAKP